MLLAAIAAAMVPVADWIAGRGHTNKNPSGRSVS